MSHPVLAQEQRKTRLFTRKSRAKIAEGKSRLPDALIAPGDLLSHGGRRGKPWQQAEPGAALQFTFLQHAGKLLSVELGGLGHNWYP
jgi:hypothetical protein